MISIDIKLQDSVEQALKAGAEDPRIAGEKGTSVVMDAATGEIYAICSLPYLDPTNREEAESDAFNLSPVSPGLRARLHLQDGCRPWPCLKTRSCRLGHAVLPERHPG